MKKLGRKGYRLTIEGWAGNLGNHLIQLSGAINVAEQTQSLLTIPPHPLLKRRVFDFLDPGNDNCLEPVSSFFFYQRECFQYPIIFDRDRRRIFQEFMHDSLARRTLRGRLLDFVKPRRDERFGLETLIINMRSGKDIFRTEPAPQDDYMQPPLSFYKHIIESHGYDDCLIVTEADRKNPCIKGLMEWRPGIRLKAHTSASDDACTLLGATNLVTCHSTFSWCLALMSKNLRNLYQPATFQIRGIDGVSISTYEFANYIEPGEWKGSNEQLALMLTHSQADIRVSHVPMAAASGRTPALSSLW